MYDKISLPTKTKAEFLSFLVLVGDVGIYWSHDSDAKVVVLAFEDVATRARSMKGFKDEIDSRLGQFSYTETDPNKKFDLSSVFKAK